MLCEAAVHGFPLVFLPVILLGTATKCMENLSFSTSRNPEVCYWWGNSVGVVSWLKKLEWKETAEATSCPVAVVSSVFRVSAFLLAMKLTGNVSCPTVFWCLHSFPLQPWFLNFPWSSWNFMGSGLLFCTSGIDGRWVGSQNESLENLKTRTTAAAMSRARNSLSLCWVVLLLATTCLGRKGKVKLRKATKM